MGKKIDGRFKIVKKKRYKRFGEAKSQMDGRFNEVVQGLLKVDHRSSNRQRSLGCQISSRERRNDQQKRPSPSNVSAYQSY